MNPTSPVDLQRRSVAVGPLTWSVVEGGEHGNPAIVFLHGWPQSARAFTEVMHHLADQFHVLAPDLPEVGESHGTPGSGTKRVLAEALHELIDTLRISNPMLVGHDIGGQIVFSYLRAYGRDVAAAAMLSMAVPGISPWFEVIRNPRIWHFAFHAVPTLPELMVADHLGPYFAFFYRAIAARPEAITAAARASYVEAYRRPEALRAGFDWYRAFAQDEKDNSAVIRVETPVLYLRGEHDGGDLAAYKQGFHASGLMRVETDTIAGSGHFIPEENALELADRLRIFSLSAG